MALVISGEHRIEADIKIVWSAINNVEILKECIPGCESLEQVSDTQMSAVVKLKIGPVSAKFKGDIHLTNLQPPNACRLEGVGKGGVAGFAKGGADVKLQADGDTTILSYEAKVEIGGKIAQLGSRLIDSTSKKLSKQFFEKFEAIVSAA